MRLILTKKSILELRPAQINLEYAYNEDELHENWRCDVLKRGVFLIVNERTLFSQIIESRVALDCSLIFDLVKKNAIDRVSSDKIPTYYANASLMGSVNGIKRVIKKMEFDGISLLEIQMKINGMPWGAIGFDIPEEIHRRRMDDLSRLN